MLILNAICLFILGACFGSLFNVIITRTTKGEDIIYKPSYCHKCNNLIPFYHNIPIISYIILQGKCSKCKESYSIQYLVNEILFGLLFLSCIFIQGNVFNIQLNTLYIALYYNLIIYGYFILKKIKSN